MGRPRTSRPVNQPRGKRGTTHADGPFKRGEGDLTDHEEGWRGKVDWLHNKGPWLSASLELIPCLLYYLCLESHD